MPGGSDTSRFTLFCVVCRFLILDNWINKQPGKLEATCTPFLRIQLFERKVPPDSPCTLRCFPQTLISQETLVRLVVAVHLLPAAVDSFCGSTAAAAILNQESATAATPGSSAHSNGGDGGGGRGHLVNVRLARFGLSCYASMSIAVGSEGLIVVTRLYLP